MLTYEFFFQDRTSPPIERGLKLRQAFDAIRATWRRIQHPTPRPTSCPDCNVCYDSSFMLLVGHEVLFIRALKSCLRSPASHIIRVSIFVGAILSAPFWSEFDVFQISTLQSSWFLSTWFLSFLCVYGIKYCLHAWIWLAWNELI